MASRVPLLLLALVAVAGPLQAQPLASAVPLFPGAEFNGTVTNEIVARHGDESPFKPPAGITRTAGEIKVYMTDAAIEDVVRFYIGQLAAIPETGSRPDPFRLGNGGHTSVTYALEMHSFEDVIDEHAHDGSVNIFGKNIRKALLDNRKPYDDGGWVNAGTFAWGRRDSNGMLTTCMISIDDMSFYEGAYTGTRTHIRVQRDVWK